MDAIVGPPNEGVTTPPVDVAKRLRDIADRLFDPILAARPANAAEVTFLCEAAEQMRTAWEGEDCDPAEAEFYLAVADYLDSEAIYIARAYLGRDL